MQITLDQHPRDALAMKMIQAIHFVMGRPQDMRTSIEGVMDAWRDHPLRGYLLECHTFTLEETGDYMRAERTGREAVALAPDDAWGLHAVAHLFDMTGRARAGLDWLNGREESWAHCNNFRYHVWWHRGLMHVDLGEYDIALALYDSDIRVEKTDDYRDISNAASLLSRFEIEGIDVGGRWEELAELAEHRATDGCLAFADLHYMLALCGGARDQAAGIIARMQKTRNTRITNEAMGIIAHPGLHIAKGLHAFVKGDYSVAWLHMNAGRADLQSIGGSHAQRDIFERITIESALRGGYLGVFFVTLLLMLLLNATTVFPHDEVGQLNLYPFINNTAANLVGLMTLTYVPIYFDILPMYIVILVLIPVMMALARIDARLAVLTSLALWFAAGAGLNLPAELWFSHPSTREWFFNPFAWQLVFFAAFALMSGWLPVPPIRRDLIWLALAVVVVSVPFAWHKTTGLSEFIRDWRDAWWFLFNKTDFGILRFVHFLALAYLAWAASGPAGVHLQRNGWTAAVIGIISRVGQKSLAVFATSMVLARVFGALLSLSDGGPLDALAVNLAGFAVIISVAYMTAFFKAKPWKTTTPRAPAADTSVSLGRRS